MKKFLSLLLALSLLLCGCALSRGSQAREGMYTVYYLAVGNARRGNDALLPSPQKLDLAEDATVRDQAEAVVRRALDQPENLTLVSALPTGVELLSLQIHQGRAYVDLSGEMRRLSGVELLLADYCLVLSLTALEGIDSVVITAEGKSLPQQPKRVFYQWDVLLSAMDEMVRTVEATLYFQSENGALVGEKRVLQLYEGQSVAETLVAALLAGPEDRDLTEVIPESFAINSIRTEEGVCYINLPADTLAALPQDAASQQLILWSLAQSLCSVDTVEQLCLLQDGQELEYFGSVPVADIFSQ